ncbi:hypothetical protein BD770DRAFT_397189 [Pilaira anomala]|nr:hypothetical protein BD770DRAFT_397189 [Pilaira anomala]
MSMSVVCRQFVVGRTNFVRSLSTQYVPGRKGYAPGFEAPEGSRETTKESNKRRQVTSLTSHLPGTTKQNSNSRSSSSSSTPSSEKKIYRQELKVTRHKYARELLEKQGQKELISAEKLAFAQQTLQATKEAFVKSKQEQKEHEKQVVEMLSLDQEETRVNSRDQTRSENRLLHEQQERNTRRKQLLKLYATTNDFVTLENLDAKVDSIISTEGRSFHESLTELMNNTNSIQSEIEQRKLQLKEVMGV